MDANELLDDVKGLLRKSIATTLKIPRLHYETTMNAQNGVERYLTMIMVIACNETLDGALDYMCEAGSLFNPNKVSREAVQKEIMACLNTFRYEIALFKKMQSMEQAGEAPESIWTKIQSMAILGEDYKTNN
jgi:hypothetical protein